MDNQDNIVSTPSTTFTPPVPPATPAPEHHFSKTLMVVIVLVLVGAISAGAYFGIFTPKNKVTLGQAVVNTMTAVSEDKIKSGSFSAVLEVSAKDVNKNYSELATDETSKQVFSQIQDISVNLYYLGVFNKNTTGDMETSGKLMAGVVNPDGGNIGMFPPQKIEVEYKVFSDQAYFNFKSLPAISAMLLPPSVNVNKYLNQWLSSPVDKSLVVTATTTLSAENKKQILNFFDKSGVFSVVNQKPVKGEDGSVTGTRLYLKIDWDKFADEIIELGQADGSMSKSEQLDIRANVEKIKEIPVSDSIITVTIGNDGYIHGYLVSAKLTDTEGLEIGSFQFSVLADEFNETFKIERPVGARSFQDVMNEISRSMM